MAGVVKNIMVRVGADLSRFNSNFAKAAGATGNFGKQTKAAMKEVFDAMRGLKMATIEDGESNAGIVSLTDKIRALKEEQAALQAMGFSWGFTRFEENEAQLRSLTEQLENYKDSVMDTPVSELAQDLRDAVDSAKGLGFKLQVAQVALKKLEFRGLGAGNSDWDDMYLRVNRLKNAVKEYKESLTDAGNKTGSFGQWLKNTAAHFVDFSKQSRKSSSGVEGLVRSIRRIGLVSVGLRLVKGMFGGLRSVVNQYVSENAALQAQVTTLKTSLGQALAPAVNLVTNALSILMPYVVGVSNAIGSLISNLFGSGWTTVAADANTAASAISGAGSAQKEFNRQLAGFDEITKLNQEISGGSGSSSSTSTTEIQGKLPTWMTNLASKIEAAFRAGDYSGIGSAIADGINLGISAINESDISLGAKISSLISNGIYVASGFVETLNWSGIGTAIKTNISDLFAGIDWAAAFKLAGSTIWGIGSMIWSMIGDGLSSALEDFQENVEEVGGNVWAGIGLGIGKALVNIATWIKDNVFSPLVEGFRSTFNIHSPSQNEEINSLGQNIMLGVLAGIAAPLKDPIGWIKANVFTPLAEGFKKIFGEGGLLASLVSSGSGSAQPVSVNLQANLTSWKDSLKNKVSAFQANFTTWKDSLKSKVSAFQANFTTWKDNLRSKVSTFTANLTNWKDSLGSKLLQFTANVKKGWTGSLADKLGISSITSKLNMTVPKISINWGYATVFNKEFKYPKGFAVKWNAYGSILNGAQLFGRVGNTFLGGGEAGREAVLPLDRNTWWMDKIGERVALKVSRNSQSGEQNITINLVVDGKVLASTVVRHVNAQARATGYHPFAAYI